MKKFTNKNSFKILLIQDNYGDIIMIQRTLQRKYPQSLIQIIIIQNGLQANQLFQKNILDILPDLIILDLNLPGVNGIDILKTIRKNKSYQYKPVLILTTSNRQYEIDQSYRRRVTTYFVKPIEQQEYQKLVQTIKVYWMDFASKMKQE